MPKCVRERPRGRGLSSNRGFSLNVNGKSFSMVVTVGGVPRGPNLLPAGIPRHLSSGHDPLFRSHRWLAKLRILQVEEIKSIPHVPVSHPFV
jgi:hypothetical protein